MSRLMWDFPLPRHRSIEPSISFRACSAISYRGMSGSLIASPQGVTLTGQTHPRLLQQPPGAVADGRDEEGGGDGHADRSGGAHEVTPRRFVMDSMRSTTCGGAPTLRASRSRSSTAEGSPRKLLSGLTKWWIQYWSLCRAHHARSARMAFGARSRLTQSGPGQGRPSICAWMMSMGFPTMGTSVPGGGSITAM